jgi:hypothetical protein
MEKLIEHRPPLDKLGFWKRPAVPQRTDPSLMMHSVAQTHAVDARV